MDEVAFRRLYQSVTPTLWGYIHHACADVVLAEDILQETFCRFLSKDLENLTEQQSKTYLYRIATSLIVDHWRRKKRERLWFALTKSEDPQNLELKLDMKGIFLKLKPREQALLWLAYVEGFQHAEIATALGLTDKSVRVLLHRARKKLAGFLQQTALH